jgi:hypothetical protein
MKTRCIRLVRPVARRRWLSLGILVCACALTARRVSAGDASLEYPVKAAFLLNFLKFVDWPSNTPQGDSSKPFVVGVLGEDPFGTILDDTFKGKVVNGRAVEIRRCDEVGAAACHLVFVSISDRERIKELLPALHEKGVLTVGETSDFQRAGGVIRFVISNERVNFEIDLSQTSNAKFKISSKLLQLAQKVRKKGD